MREELRTIGSKGRHVFTATFVRFGFRKQKDLVVLIYRQAMWLSFAQGLVLTRKDTRGTRMMYLIDR